MPAERETSLDSYRLYMEEVAKIPLLSKQEEINLAQRYREGVESRLLIASDEYGQDNLENFKEAIEQGARAKKILWESNQRWVVKLAMLYRGHGLPLDDLIQEGNLGLERAITKFDPEKGYRFSTYAKLWIESFIKEAISKSRLIHIPEYVFQELKEQDSQNGFNDRLRKAEQALEPIVSLSQPAPGDQDDESVSDLLADSEYENFPVEDQAIDAISLEEALKFIEQQLSPQQYLTFLLKTGIEDGVQKTNEEVSKIFGRSTEYSRRLFNGSVESLSSTRFFKEKLTG